MKMIANRIKPESGSEMTNIPAEIICEDFWGKAGKRIPA